MNTKWIVIGFVSAFLIILSAGTYVGMYVNYSNKEVSLRNAAEAQRGNIENIFDKTWKVIQQKAQVTDEYKNAFKEIYPALMEGRYSKGDGSLMKWVQESNPDFDASLYKDLMNSIEVERTAFSHQQKYMLDIIREHNVLLQSIPSKWFVSNTLPIQYTVISSSKSKAVMVSGEDNDVDLFKKNK